MKRAVSIDGITFDYPLFVSSEYETDDFVGNQKLSNNGKTTKFVQNKISNTKEEVLFSNENGWVSSAVKSQLLLSANLNAVEVEFDDASTGTYYYDFTKIPISFVPLYEGAEWFKVTINLLKG